MRINQVSYERTIRARTGIGAVVLRRVSTQNMPAPELSRPTGIRFVEYSDFFVRPMASNRQCSPSTITMRRSLPAFLDPIERQRANRIRPRNATLAAIRSLFSIRPNA